MATVLQRHIARRQPPLVAKHIEERLFRVSDRQRIARQVGIALAAQQQRIEISAARIGVDLDQMCTLLVEMKIVTVEHAQSMLWRTVIPTRQARHPLGRRDHLLHLLQLLGADIHRHIGKQIWTTLRDQLKP